MLLIVALTSSSLILCSSWLNNPPPPYNFLDFYYIIIYIILFLLLKPTFLKQSMKMTDVLKKMVWKQLFFFHSQLLQGTNVVIIDITCGVPQGSILGLLLFSVYKSLGQTLNTHISFHCYTNVHHYSLKPHRLLTKWTQTEKEREREARSINYISF